MTKKKRISLNNLEETNFWFFRTYNPDKWLIKIDFLKDSYENFENIYGYMTNDKFNKEEYKIVIREELHFLIFQMIETLFELIFALKDHNESELPISLTFANNSKTHYYSKTYDKIRDYSKDKINLLEETSLEINNKKIPILRKILYFNAYSEKNDEIFDENMIIIDKILKILSTKFIDREEYNAYKHSSRESNSGFKMDLEFENTNQKVTIIDSRDAIHYLSSEKKNNLIKLRQVAKTFNFEIDYEVAIIVYKLIYNIITIRKSNLFNEHNGEYGVFSFDEKDYETVKKSIGSKFIVDM